MRLDLVLVMLLGMNIPLLTTSKIFSAQKVCLGGGGGRELGPYIDGDESTEWHSWKHLGWDMTRNTSEVSVF